MTTTDDTLWKAGPDIFAISARAERFIDAMDRAVGELRLESTDYRMSFVTHTRRTRAQAGPALVVSDIAEDDAGQRETAVVVSAVVHDNTPMDGQERLVVIRTHLEDQHTRHQHSRLLFEEHHDRIRAALVAAVLAVEPGAEHRMTPVAPEDPEADDHQDDDFEDEPAVRNRVKRATRRDESQPVVEPLVKRPGVDVRSFLGVGLLVVGVVLLLVAIATGSVANIAFGVAAAIVLGYVGSRLSGN